MQEHTSKESDYSKTRRANPIHVVDTSRLASSNVEALREVHMSLVRAEQNLINLAQSNQVANGGHFPTGAFAYPTQNGFTAGIGASGFAPGFAPASIPSTPAGLAVGMGPSIAPWGAIPQQPLLGWGLPPVGVPATLASLQAAAGIVPSALIANAALFGAGIASRTPACDITDEGKQFVCLVELPGLRTDQVEVLCQEHTVLISAYRETEADVVNLVQSERGTATLQRTIVLPAEVQPGSAKATLSNGVLSIVLPKVHPTEGPRRIKVQG